MKITGKIGTDVKITGKIKRYSRQRMGSFRNVMLEGQTQWITIGLGEDRCYPEPGDTITVHGVDRDGRFLTTRWEYTPLCEVCDEPILEEPITDERTGKRGFCSDGCLQEALDDKRIADIEAKQQFELYGDDMDSWYR